MDYSILKSPEGFNETRNSLACLAVAALSRFSLGTYYNVSYQNIGNIPTAGQFILLPKHQSQLDIMLEGALLQQAGRYGFYLMKNGLPKSVLEPLGGIPIVRPKDLRKMKSEERRGELQRLKDYNFKLFNELIPYLLSNGQIIIVHPEGTRHYQEISEVPRLNIAHLLETQEKLGEQITFIPLDIEYEDKNRPRSDIVLTVQEPIKVPDGNEGIEMLIAHLEKSIELIGPKDK